MSGQHRAPGDSAAERFAALIRPKARKTEGDTPPRVTEDADFLRMMWRMVRALEARSIDRPENLSQVIALAQRLAEVPNVVIATSAARHAVNPYSSPSMGEISRLLGMTKQSASDRRKIGDRVIGERVAAAGAVQFAEAKRETAAIDAARDHAVTVLADFLARRRAA